jgi:hypothetical protein
MGEREEGRGKKESKSGKREISLFPLFPLPSSLFAQKRNKYEYFTKK